MSSATVATIACLALVGAVAMAVWVALQQRRTDALARALTARKWDIVTLRAELGALRRQMQGTGDGPADPAADTDADTGAEDDAEAERAVRSGEDDAGDGEPGSPSTVGVSRAPVGPAPSPTAWRRDRARAASSRPRRRRRF